MWGKYGGRALFDRKTIRFTAVRDKKSPGPSETGERRGREDSPPNEGRGLIMSSGGHCKVLREFFCHNNQVCERVFDDLLCRIVF